MTGPSRQTILKAQNLAREHFDLLMPMSITDLKKAYRTAGMELHPDKGGDGESFKHMRAAYDFLVSLHTTAPQLFTANGEAAQPLSTIDGTPLSELGLGLGPTTNGKDCPHCGRKGYTTEYGNHWVVCGDCDEYGRVPKTSSCRDCRGTGRFTTAKTKRVVTCRKCNGTGLFKHPLANTACPRCLGTKMVWRENRNQPYYVRCLNCDGTGEIELLNPVIPKGAIGQVPIF